MGKTYNIVVDKSWSDFLLWPSV